MKNRFKLSDLKELTPTLNNLNFDWNSIESLCPQLSVLKNCYQEPEYHGEGDVATHTQMVLKELINDSAWQNLNEADRFKLFWTAVFHDIGKPGTTMLTDEGRITSAGHSKLGEFMTREILRAANIDILLREEICAMINAHQLPFWLFEREDAYKTACKFSLVGNAEHLLIHTRADARGRICHDVDDLLLKVDLSKAVFEDIGVLNTAFNFPNDESRFAYFEKEDRDLHYEAHEDFRCEATLVCGLPGTGKDTWIGKNLNDQPVVSLDKIRERMKIQPTDDQGTVIQTGLEEAKVHLRASKDFVWNAVNITKMNRDKITKILRDYNARIKIVYLETHPDTLLKQNNDRKATVPVSVINNLSRKLQPPSPIEGHTVEWYYENKLVNVNGKEYSEPPKMSL